MAKEVIRDQQLELGSTFFRNILDVGGRLRYQVGNQKMAKKKYLDCLTTLGHEFVGWSMYIPISPS